jgi:UDP:flavonoid glycosyltransferase YjiC (YdhE family)
MLLDSAPPLSLELDEWLSDGPAVVYVNFGTVVRPSPAQLTSVAQALASPYRRALWVLKPNQGVNLRCYLGRNVRVIPWAESPRAILAHPNVKAFVSHCGINSVHESLHSGTPIVGIPFYADQLDMAVRVADAGVGLWIDKSRFSAQSLSGAIDRVIDEPSFVRNIVPLQAAFRRAGGVERAADLIQRAVAPSILARATTCPRKCLHWAS